jgi:multidrug efflux pump subunit AcrB
MWIVKVALERPYTFIVLALLILILSPVVVLNTPTDIFPNIDIPVVAVSWTYAGMNPEELEGRLTTVYEKVLTTLVDNIEHIESTTVNGTVVVKIFLQAKASVDRANAQVTAASQSILRQLPPGTLPPLIVNYTASSVPILQLSLSGPALSEADLNDLALNFLRPQLVTVPGAAVPYPYGGKQREVMVNLDSGLLQSKGLSPQDVVNAVNAQNVVAPSGTAKIDQFEYDIETNSAPKTVEETNNLPVKVVGNSTIYVGDVSHVSDGFVPQTNIVRQDGRRGVLATVIKDGDASTLSVVQGIRAMLPRVQETLPLQLKIQQLADQSVFVRAAIGGVVREACIAALLTALMILLFLGSWRSTLIIGVSIPLAILSSVIMLGFRHETINLMTLSGLALAVGILVDDATVTIENISRHLEEGQPLHQGILEGAAQIAVPALVSTLCICIVFMPMFSLGAWRIIFFSARRGGNFRHAGVVYPVANVGSNPGDVPSQTSRRKRPALAQSPGPGPEGVRPWIRGFSAGIQTAPNKIGGQTIPFCTHVSIGLSCGCRARTMAWPGLFPKYRQRPIHSSCSCQNRNAYRRHRNAVRPRRTLDPARDSEAGSG